MKKRYSPLFILAAILILPLTAHATIDILPAKSAQIDEAAIDSNSTHPPLRITPDKSELIRLKQEAATILIGNPNHLSILAENSKTLVVIPHAPGASHFTILDKDGDIIMQRHVITAAPKQNYVRVRRSCAGSQSKECQQTSVFYCPDMCHSIQTGTRQDAQGGDKTAPKDNQPGAEEYAQAALKKATEEQEPTED